jgi:hypothetical protein
MPVILSVYGTHYHMSVSCMMSRDFKGLQAQLSSHLIHLLADITLLDRMDQIVDSCGRAVHGVGMRRLTCSERGFESRRGMDVCLWWLLCVVREKSLPLADHSSEAVLRSVVCLSVISKPQKWGGPGPLGPSKIEGQERDQIRLTDNKHSQPITTFEGNPSVFLHMIYVDERMAARIMLPL